MRELNERQKKSDEIQQQMQKVFDNIVTGKQQLQLSFRINQGNQALATTGAVANTSALPRSEDVSQSKQFSEEAQQSPPPPDYNNTRVATIHYGPTDVLMRTSRCSYKNLFYVLIREHRCSQKVENALIWEHRRS
ncbi:uncharacterized protein ATC70_000828 [Mucor velutinosus]|uniref:Uncharacterized protein n=1 Tax=Mucor velutinosus TaxID=708070 RepID=A0AAN7HNN2_9FUNG|nr:hypothetical protein ATC70_000828 [Mucor velutinosus]